MIYKEIKRVILQFFKDIGYIIGLAIFVTFYDDNELPPRQ